jgi:NADH-quinone oxidoreductase subunit C/D
LTVSMTRIGGMAQDAPEGWFEDVLAFCKEMRDCRLMRFQMLFDNKIFIKRTQGVAPVSCSRCDAIGVTRVLCCRACGVNLDLRKTAPYYGYDGLEFDVPVGTNGDIYDRYLVRIEEMRQSIRIIEQVCRKCSRWRLHDSRQRNCATREKRCLR